VLGLLYILFVAVIEAIFAGCVYCITLNFNFIFSLTDYGYGFRAFTIVVSLIGSGMIIDVFIKDKIK